MPPARPAEGEFPADIGALMRFNGGEPTFDAVTTFFVDLMAQAFACDVTRFGTLVFNDLPYDVANNATTDSLGLGLPSDLHNLVAHQYVTRSYDRENELASTGDAATWLPLAKYKYVYGKVARFLQRLDELGAFDSVLVYVTSELGNPNGHSSCGVPTVLAGGVNVPFRFGRRLQIGPDCMPPNDSCAPRDQKYADGATNHLLVSIAQAFGAEPDSFGQGADGTYTTGALPRTDLADRTNRGEALPSEAPTLVSLGALRPLPILLRYQRGPPRLLAFARYGLGLRLGVLAVAEAFS